MDITEIVDFTVIFGVIVLVSGWNYSTDRTNLRNLKKEIKDRHAHIGDSKVTLYGINGIDLAGEDVPVTAFRYTTDSNLSKDRNIPLWGMDFSFIVKNGADTNSGSVYYKILKAHPVVPGSPICGMRMPCGGRLTAGARGR